MTDLEGTPREGFKAASALPDDIRDALGLLLLSLADNKRLLGLRYSDWMLGAPSVESGIACSAMAQDEWGHARIVYAVLRGFGYDPKTLEHERPAESYCSSRLLDRDVATWEELLTLNFLLDTALSVQFEALLDSRFEPIHYKVRKLLAEERFHFDHGQGWVRRLLQTGKGREALAKAFRTAWNDCLAWFGPSDDPKIKLLVHHGILRHGPDEVRARWLDRVGGLADEAGVEIRKHEIHWNGWIATRRRTGAGGPDEDTLARARGDRNRALLMD